MRSDSEGSPQASHKNGYIRTSDNTPEEKDNHGAKFGETASAFMDIKENLDLECSNEKLSRSLSDIDSSSSCTPFSSDSFDQLEDEEMKETVKDTTNFQSAPCRLSDLYSDNFGSLTSVKSSLIKRESFNNVTNSPFISSSSTNYTESAP